MAKINKQEIIQKLIDELNLYPGKDTIPTELAEKILAVYQINTQEVEVQLPAATVLKQGKTGTTTAAVLYTVPATGKFFLTNASLRALIGDLDADGLNYFWMLVTPLNGTATKIININLAHKANMNGVSDSVQINLQSPLQLEPESVIEVDQQLQIGDPTEGYADGTIIGYTTD